MKGLLVATAVIVALLAAIGTWSYRVRSSQYWGLVKMVNHGAYQLWKKSSKLPSNQDVFVLYPELAAQYEIQRRDGGYDFKIGVTGAGDLEVTHWADGPFAPWKDVYARGPDEKEWTKF
jgi:hypothetical protein